MNLFSQVIDEYSSDITDRSDEFLTTEAVYAGDIPYMNTLPRIFNLPKGEPFGRGNLCFLYSNSVDISIDDISVKLKKETPFVLKSYVKSNSIEGVYIYEGTTRLSTNVSFNIPPDLLCVSGILKLEFTTNIKEYVIYVNYSFNKSKEVIKIQEA
jgi:hypothetical protein